MTAKQTQARQHAVLANCNAAIINAKELFGAPEYSDVDFGGNRQYKRSLRLFG